MLKLSLNIESNTARPLSVGNRLGIPNISPFYLDYLIMCSYLRDSLRDIQFLSTKEIDFKK